MILCKQGFEPWTDAIRFIDAGDCAAARETLVKAQQETEEIYINTAENCVE